MDESIDFEPLAQELYQYDVLDGGWEGDPAARHNPQSVERNVGHVLLQLVDSVERKAFWQPDLAENEIAPDSLQYALRFVRWGILDLDTIRRTNGTVDETFATSVRTGIKDQSLAAVVSAMGVIGRNRHNADHASSREKAIHNIPETLTIAARLLVYSAQLQEEKFEFDLPGAFHKRLAGLRKRYNIVRTA